DGADALQVFLQTEGIALHGKIEVADGKTTDDVPHGAAGEINIHPGFARHVLHQDHATLLLRREPHFHRVDVIRHALCFRTPDLCRRFVVAQVQSATNFRSYTIAPAG